MEPQDHAPEPKAKAHPIPPPRGSELEKGAVHAAWKAKELKREQHKVELRGAERLAFARERHRAFRARQLRDREAAAESLQRDISQAQEHLWKTQIQTDAALEEMEAQHGVYQAQEAEAHLAKQRAQQRVFGSREESATFSAWTETEAHTALRQAEEAVEARKSEVKNVVDFHRTDRLEFKEKLLQDIAAREAETKAFVEDVIHQTKSSLRLKESQRHHAVSHLDKVAEMHQATRTQAQGRMKLHEEKSKQQVKELEKMTHQLRMRSDEALAEKMTQTTGHLAAAKAFCAEVKASIGEEIRLAKLNVAKIEEEAAMNTRNEQRKVQELESKALDNFKESVEEAQSTWQETATKRKALQAELEDLHAKYQSLHDATQAKMKSIMEEWKKDRESMEEKVKACEERRQEAFDGVTQAMRQTTEAMEARNKEMQESCIQIVLQCQRQSEDQVFQTYETAAEAARREELFADETLKEAQQWKGQIQGIEERADEEINAYQLRAQSVEVQLEKDAQAQVNLSKRLAQTAHEEEKVYISETAAAWARLRKACYHLRLANLHDFAKSITAGEFDAKIGSEN